MRALLYVVILAACGGGGGSALDDKHDKLTSLADTKKMGELSKVEKKQLCEDFKAYQKKTKPSEDETLRMACNAKAALSTMSSEAKDDAGIQAACKKERDACIAKKEKAEEKELDCASEDFLGKMGECKDLTVAEITDCVKDMSTVMKKFSTEDLCSTVKAGDKETVTRIFEKMKSSKCELLETKCQAGAGSGGQMDDKLAEEALVKVKEYSAKMCACKDKGCATQISEAMNKWGEEMAAKNPNVRPGPEMTKKLTEAATEYAACMSKLVAEEAPAPAPAPEAPTPAKK
jgi:hypothetical protein